MKTLTSSNTLTVEPRQRFECKECGWQGTQPSWSDTSIDLRRDAYGNQQTLHIPVCPRCLGSCKSIGVMPR
jgi:hypothetical protein